MTAPQQSNDAAQEVGAFAQSTCRALDGDDDRRNYHSYQHSLIAPQCGSALLEIGAGTGALSARFHNAQRRVVTDVDPEAVAYLEQRFAGRPDVEVRQLNLLAGEALDRPVDSAIAVNVLEHLEDDAGALRALARSVRPGGSIVLFVPGYDQLYGDFDRKVGHVRRYTPARLRRAVEQAGLTVTSCRPVNLIGGLAWWAAVRKGGTGSPRPRMVRLYDRLLVPLTRALERFWTPPFGQSIFCVARVPARDAG
ncbi:MAG TPA: methyltransferase [Euzebyales bacterium]|nr:methyltransferase [Euzebyales bacterium]